MRPASRSARSPAVITGVGAVCAFGAGFARLADALAAGEHAVGPLRSFDPTGLPTTVGGEVPAGVVDIDPRLHATGAGRDRKIAFAIAAAREAWRDGGCDDHERDAALSIGLGLERALLEDFAPLLRPGQQSGHAIDWDAERALPGPAVRLRAPVDLAARWVARDLALRGPTTVHVSACAAGALAVAHAAAMVERGQAELVLCGAADSMLNPLGLGGMGRLGAPSPRAAPDACRPFDRRRDGLAIGEGAAMFVVESLERARARGARPRALILGWGSTQDAHAATAPRPDGVAAAAAMRAALSRARLSPRAVGYINAHGTGTPLGDPAEIAAIRLALGSDAGRVPLSSIKGAVGHLMAAAGALELAACLLPLSREILPGTAHHRQRGPDCDLDVIGEAPRSGRVDVVLSNSFGFGGQNATVILGRPA